MGNRRRRIRGVDVIRIFADGTEISVHHRRQCSRPRRRRRRRRLTRIVARTAGGSRGVAGAVAIVLTAAVLTLARIRLHFDPTIGGSRRVRSQ